MKFSLKHQLFYVLISSLVSTHYVCAQTCIYADFDYQIGYDNCNINFTVINVSGVMDKYEWDFGDGAQTEGSTVSHTFATSGCFYVSILAYSGSDVILNGRQVCLPGCNTDPGSSPLPDCVINGPTQAAADQTITLTGEGIGVGPFDYQWTTPLRVTPDDPQGAVQNFTMPDRSNNGTDHRFTLWVTDALGEEKSCSHTIGGAGNSPSAKLAVFHDATPMTPIDMLAFMDWANLTYPVRYHFSWENLQTAESGNSGWLDEIANWSLLDGLPDGDYIARMQVADAAGQYYDEQNFRIGTPPPPSPEVEIINLNTDAEPHVLVPEETLDFQLKFNQDVFAPQLPDYFYVQWHFTDLATGQELLNWPGVFYGPATSCWAQSGLARIAYEEFAGCFNGSVAITATLRRVNDNCGQLINIIPYIFEVTEPLIIDVVYQPAVIKEVALIEDCNPYLSADVTMGCRAETSIPAGAPCTGSQYYQEYEWQAFDVDDPSVELENFFISPQNSSCITIDRNHSYFKRFAPGDFAMFVLKLTVIDHLGFFQYHTQVMVMNPPMNVFLPEAIHRCPGSRSLLQKSPFIIGGNGPFIYNWSNSPDLAYLDLTNPAQPYIDIPANYSGSLNFELSITDAQGCTTGPQQIEVIVDPLLAQAGDGRSNSITTCLGPSLKKLGHPNGSASGGSGNYFYEWSPTTGLDDPYSERPQLNLTINQTVLYTLTVTDEYGCTATDVVSVTPQNSAVPIVAQAGLNHNVCYGEEQYILGSPIDPELSADWIIPDLDLKLAGDNSGGVTVGTEASLHPGTYDLTQRVYDPYTGCFDEDQSTLTVQEQWKYEGYEPSIGVAVLGEGVPVWETGNNQILSGAVGNLSYSWEATAPPPFDVTNNSNGVPANSASYLPTNDYPSLSLQLTDEVGCELSLLSKRYLLLSETPSIDISSIPEPAVGCIGDEICFEVQLTAPPLGTNVSLFPPGLTAQFLYFTDRSAVGLSQLNHNQGDLELTLTDGINGLYSGNFCIPLNAGTAGVYALAMADFVKVSGNLDPEGHPSTAFEESIQIMTSSSFVNNETITVCQELEQGGLGVDNLYVARRHRIRVKPKDNCTMPLVPNAASSSSGEDHIAILMGGKDGGVNITSLTVEEGAYFHALIDPCITESLQEEEIETAALLGNKSDSLINKLELSVLSPLNKVNPKQEIPGLDLQIFPNPFTGEIKIHYELQNEYPEIVSLNLLSLTGQYLHQLITEQKQQAGSYRLSYNGTHLPPGTYFFELKIGNQKLVKKVIKITNL